MAIELNPEQILAKANFIHWYKHPESRVRPWYEVSGPAGSGKTTLVKLMIKELEIDMTDVVFCAYTGKAALQLRLSGVPGRTIHSMVYDLTIENVKDEKGYTVYENGKPKTRMKFEKREHLEPNIKLIVVDEGGMVEEHMAEDLLTFGVPVLVLGDLHQLPPVFGKPKFLTHPDSILTKAMRQKEGSPIIYLSQLAIAHAPIYYGFFGAHNEARVIRKDDFMRDFDLAKLILSWSDMTICGTNAMRDKINQFVRKNIQHIESNTVSVGDTLICRQNKWDIMLGGQYSDIALVNGLVGTCTYVNKDPHQRSAFVEIDFQPEFIHDDEFADIPLNHKYLFSPYGERKAMNGMMSSSVLFEFGSAITCHLSQGSQAQKVVVIVEQWRESPEFYSWLYTAITRARTELILII